ncbi:MAG TPA: hypothetical protein VNO43_08690 [Candidatus Eisenbacteria bacterium]|nr:hypothetical protein [Candidatus Eisenbacteria bacterium]
MQIYRVWSEGPWDLPAPSDRAPLYFARSAPEPARQQLPGTETIVSRNVFDPERGEGRTTEVADNSRSYQRVRNMVLLGTAILGSNRVAILQDSSTPRTGPTGAGSSPEVMRVKLGDTIEGFRLSEIADRRVVFTKGPSRVEVLLDYFRKVEAPAPPAPSPQAPAQAVGPRPVVPRVVPPVPRRDRLPQGANPAPES